MQLSAQIFSRHIEKDANFKQTILQAFDENVNECCENDSGPHNGALGYLETAIKWLQRQENADRIQPMYLRRMCGSRIENTNIFFLIENSKSFFFA